MTKRSRYVTVAVMSDLGHTIRTWRPDPDGPAWLVKLHFAEIHGRAECVGIEVRSFATEDEQRAFRAWPERGQVSTPVTTSVLRSIPLGRMVQEHRDRVATTTRSQTATSDHWQAFLAEHGIDADRWEAFAEHGDDEELERFASGTDIRERFADYLRSRDVEPSSEDVRRQLEAWEVARSGGRPAQYDAEHWAEVAEVYREGWQRGTPTKAVAEHFTVSKSTAAKWVARCRTLGLLPVTSKGKGQA